LINRKGGLEIYEQITKERVSKEARGKRRASTMFNENTTPTPSL
jgi:hypothetical protein